ncbi:MULTISPECIES: transcription/translation regulatory transformer protein RfaH [unclassified Arsukibacterium]|uniref:transcription/translation regulatory transformer protein RfaH n=1 Tax=unclassified Arsukibacterium TaxID=2635278 RepID=UPI000C97A624|nr:MULTISPECIES: transcription/translation regulatory transformer protein RfaH [unclassified Arsukibacterium]MAA95091.1 transcription/translation regulatory transformer protein RfaH [Rheinheimera sp.]HAW94465.1 transcription/translation regulatory transformer protein RfaH [Candidatus Azambacteria bacterium]|tara:strand:+ start:24125 stop:24658 length:534 start_codon:yes stop_codon:yes gene_type:complete
MVAGNLKQNCWYLLYCKPRQEQRAQQHLANQGFSSFVPVLTVNKLKAGKQVKVTEPMFPRYLFLQISSEQLNLSTIRSTRGVTDFVRFGQQLAQVPNSLITTLSQQQMAQQQQEDQNQPFKPGDELTVLNGPFSGIQAVYQLADGDKRSIVLLNLLGQWVKTAMDNQQISKSQPDKS